MAREEREENCRDLSLVCSFLRTTLDSRCVSPKSEEERRRVIYSTRTRATRRRGKLTGHDWLGVAELLASTRRRRHCKSSRITSHAHTARSSAPINRNQAACASRKLRNRNITHVWAIVVRVVRVYLSFFLGRRLLEWPHFFLRQLVALGGSLA